jgi:hypothetical protein
MPSATRWWLPRLLIGAWLLVGGAVFGQINLEGQWNSAEFGTVSVFQNGSDVWVLAPRDVRDKCGRTVYLSGFLEGDKLIGSMWRCTEQELIDKCKHPDKYKIDFTATVSQQRWPVPARQIASDSMQLNVDFKMQYWNTTACKEEKMQPQGDLLMKDFLTNAAPMPTPTPTPTPPPQQQTSCGGHGFLKFIYCLGWERDWLEWPSPNGAP